MPTIVFSLDDLQQLTGKKITPGELAELAHYAKGELESYDKKTKEASMSLDDTNLPYLWSVEGLARLYKGVFGKQKGIALLTTKKSKFIIKVNKGVEKIRPYITAFVAKGPALNDYGLKQLIQLQEKFCEGYGRKRKKISIGLYTTKHIDWPVHYTITLPEKNAFIPLQETKKMTPREILQQHSKGREYGGIIQDKKYFPLLKDNNDEVLSLPPIINSDRAGKIEVGETEFLFEATGDDEQGLHLGTAIFAQALAERGYTIHQVSIQYNKKQIITPVLQKNTLRIKKEEINKMLGLTLNENQIKTLLEKAGFNYQKGLVTIPHYRDDIMHAVDIIEDVAIMYGFQNITPLPLKNYTVGSPLPDLVFYEQLREILIGLGYQEIFNQILTSKETMQKKMNVNVTAENKKTERKQLIEIANYSSEKYTVVRNGLLPLLLETMSKSRHADYPQYIFEQGIVAYRKEKKIEEKEKIAVAIAKTSANFSDAKQVLEALLRPFGIHATMQEQKDERFIAGRCAAIVVEGMDIGVVGELHPQVLTNFGMEVPVVGFELDAEKLIEYMKK